MDSRSVKMEVADSRDESSSTLSTWGGHHRILEKNRIDVRFPFLRPLGVSIWVLLTHKAPSHHHVPLPASPVGRTCRLPEEGSQRENHYASSPFLRPRV